MSRVPYVWHWPGTPGGYVPVIAEELAAEQAKAEATRAKFGKSQQALAGQASKAAQKGKSMPGGSKASEEAVARYKARGLEIDARAEAAKGKAPPALKRPPKRIKKPTPV
jgi:hypothetical protein